MNRMLWPTELRRHIPAKQAKIIVTEPYGICQAHIFLFAEIREMRETRRRALSRRRRLILFRLAGQLHIAVHHGAAGHGHKAGLDIAVDDGALFQRQQSADLDVAGDGAGAGDLAGKDTAVNGGVVTDDKAAVDVDIARQIAADQHKAGSRHIAVEGRVQRDLALGGDVTLALTGDLHITLGGDAALKHGAAADIGALGHAAACGAHHDIVGQTARLLLLDFFICLLRSVTL